MSKSPEKELEEFLAPKPAWMRRAFQEGFPSLTQDERLDWVNNAEEVVRLTPEYERILQLIPANWKAYCKRHKQEARVLDKYLVPKVKLGRPLDSKAQEYFDLYSSGVSCREIAKRELQAGPEGTDEELRLDTASESIRQSIIRYRRRMKI